jgi:DNA-binding IclR family transcriptional regulator
MTDKNKKHHDEQKGGVNPIAAAVTGVVVGAAAIGIAGAAVMANDDTRKKVEKAIDEAKDNINNMIKDVD